jgi:hypothetical protein
MPELAEALYAVSDDIRYVAIYRDGSLALSEREGLAGASSSESDKYEELLVNPTLLTLVRQRGNIDCGGVEFVLIRYGNFYQWVMPIQGGHVSISIQPDADPLKLVAPIRATLVRHGVNG